MFLIVGVFFLYEGIEAYREHLIQQNWIEAEAYVTQISSRKESVGFGKRSSTKIVYDVEYIFDVPPMETYFGSIKGSAKYYDTGDVLTIKYDPNNPHDSTSVLYSDKNAIIIGTILSVGVAFGGMLVVILITNAKSKKRSQVNKPKNRRPYSVKDPSLRGYPVKLVIMGVLSKLSIGGAGIMASVGALFILMAILAKTVIIFYVAGGIALIMYFIIGVLSPIKQIDKLYNELGNDQFYRIVDKALESPKNSYSDYDQIIGELYRACPNLDE